MVVKLVNLKEEKGLRSVSELSLLPVLLSLGGLHHAVFKNKKCFTSSNSGSLSEEEVHLGVITQQEQNSRLLFKTEKEP